MNERIKDLIDSSYISVLTTKGMECIVDGCYIVSPDRLEKFAELIVRECIQQLRYKSAQLVDVEYFPEYKEQLEKHFGIKE